MKENVQYTLCDSPSTFDYAMQILWRAPFLILDCEGNSLGRAGGSLSLICVGSPLAENIFIFDALSPSLTRSDFEPLWQLFRNPRIIKVVWDGRMDFLEIWSTYGVGLEGALDLQVAEVVSRVTMRGEGELHRLERLTHSGFSPHAVWNFIPQYAGLHAVLGLSKCCRDSGFGDDFCKDPEVMKMHKDNKGEMWMSRPLTEQLLQYAAKDIQLISMLCTDFIQRGWIPSDPTTYHYLLRQCARYVSAHREQGKSTEQDVFRPTSIIPLDVLTEPTGNTHKCVACNRTKSEQIRDGSLYQYDFGYLRVLRLSSKYARNGTIQGCN
ncbi:Ribonuclease H superfamily protein [Abortiporus biennis]